jgi:hypothetical protein
MRMLMAFSHNCIPTSTALSVSMCAIDFIRLASLIVEKKKMTIPTIATQTSTVWLWALILIRRPIR